jgi:hypothetical protein
MVAGSAFLLNIVPGLPAGMLMARATSAEGAAAELVGVAQHANDARRQEENVIQRALIGLRPEDLSGVASSISC